MFKLKQMWRIWKKSRQAKKFIGAQIYISAHSPMYDPPKVEDVFKTLSEWGMSKKDLDCASLSTAPKQKQLNHIIKD